VDILKRPEDYTDLGRGLHSSTSQLSLSRF
jgi:hypothetical protein